MPPASAEPAPAYDAGFFADQASESGRSAAAIVPIVMELVKPASVLDVGCGVGAWLAAFAAAGVNDYLGLDGVYVDRSKLLIDPARFQDADLARPPVLVRTFDLAVCLEVGEHLPESAAVGLVQTLTAAAPAILFSAATPGQGGTGHVNEQWPAFWRKLFADRGYVRLDPVRPRVWRDLRVMPWYKLNTFLFVRESEISTRPDWDREWKLVEENPFELVNAWNFERNLPLTFRRALISVPVLAWRAIQRRIRR